MISEELLLNNGEKVTANITIPSWRLVKQLKRKYLVINKIVPEGNGVKSMEGVFDFEGISEEVFDKCVHCDNKDDIEPLEVDRIFNKYYSKYFMPNGGDEEKKSSLS